MKKKNLYLLGGGGHCVSAIDVIEATNNYDIEGIIDLSSKVGSSVLGYNIIDTEENLSKYVQEDNYFVITIGQIKSSEPRERLYKKLKDLGANIATIISPTSHVSKHSKIGEGTIVFHQCVVNAGVSIGSNCIINNKSLIEHDVVIGDHTHISTAAIVNGDCKIGSNCFVGSNCVLEQGLTVRDKSLLSAVKFHRCTNE